jgi:hypothetical protein
MFGFIGFTASDGLGVINFTTYLGNDINGNHGIHMNPSIAAPINSFLLFPYVPLTSFSFNFFYLKTWICPSSTIFNSITNMCESNTTNPSSGDISFSVIYI